MRFLRDRKRLLIERLRLAEAARGFKLQCAYEQRLRGLCA
jgi:hypothetical protein